MKTKLFGIIAIIAVLVFSMAACGDKESGDTLSPDHTHTPGAAATCTTAQTCTGCGKVIQPSLGHSPGAAATCAAAQTCKNCGEVIQAKLAHTPGMAATCTTAQTCTICNTVMEAALGHKGIGAIQPTCITEGNTGEGTCTRCFESVTGDVIPRAAHTYSDGICTVCFGIEMVQIPAGIFTMGPDVWGDNAEFSVTVSAFKMGKYQVTQELYQAVMGTNPSNFNGEAEKEPDAGEVQGKRPVEQVTWYNAVEFCNALSAREGLTPYYTITKGTPDPNNTNSLDTIKWLITPNAGASGYRLPGDAQWEYACRANSTSDSWCFGDTESELVKYAWYSDNSNSKTHQVGMKKPNNFGLYDMHGNVWEWCWDWHGKYPAGPETDYTGAVSGAGRIARGGSWLHLAVNIRSVVRRNDNPCGVYSTFGFRVVAP